MQRAPFVHPLMNLPRSFAVLGFILLGVSLPAADGVTAAVDGVRNTQQEQNTPSDHSTGQAEVHKKRDKAQGELDAVNQPKTLAAGAPSGTPQEELLERRTLLHHIVRSLDEQIDDTLRMEQARRRRADMESTAATAAAAPEESP